MCWEHPRPGLSRWVSIDFASPTEGYAVTATGLIAQFVNGQWRALRAGDGSVLKKVWSMPGEAWFVGEQGRVLRYVNNAFVSIPSGTTDALNAVFGFSSTDVWVVGDNGRVLHWDGVALGAVTSGTSGNLLSVWGPHASFVVAVGRQGTIVRYNGIGWAAFPTRPAGTTTGDVFTIVHGRSDTDFVVDADNNGPWRFNGSTWTPLTGSALGTLDLKVLADGTVWGVGYSGSIVAWNSSGGANLTTGTANDLYGIAFQGSTLWAVGVNGEWLTRSGSTVTRRGARDWPTLGAMGNLGGGLVALGQLGVGLRRTDAGWLEFDAGIGSADVIGGCEHPTGGLVALGRSSVFYVSPTAGTSTLPDAGLAMEQVVCSSSGAVWGRNATTAVSLLTSPAAPAWTPLPFFSALALAPRPTTNQVWLFGGTQLSGSSYAPTVSLADPGGSSVLTILGPVQSGRSEYTSGFAPTAQSVLAARTFWIDAITLDGGVSPGPSPGAVFSYGSTPSHGPVVLGRNGFGTMLTATMLFGSDGGQLNAEQSLPLSLTRVVCQGSTCWLYGEQGAIARRAF